MHCVLICLWWVAIVTKREPLFAHFYTRQCRILDCMATMRFILFTFLYLWMLARGLIVSVHLSWIGHNTYQNNECYVVVYGESALTKLLVCPQERFSPHK